MHGGAVWDRSLVSKLLERAALFRASGGCPMTSATSTAYFAAISAICPAAFSRKAASKLGLTSALPDLKKVSVRSLRLIIGGHRGARRLILEGCQYGDGDV